MDGLEHMSKTDIQIWQRVFDLIEGAGIEEPCFRCMESQEMDELGSMVLEVQHRLAEQRQRAESAERQLAEATRTIAALLLTLGKREVVIPRLMLVGFSQQMTLVQEDDPETGGLRLRLEEEQ